MDHVGRTSVSWTPQKCERCGYDLRGNPSPVCPECGAAKVGVPVSVDDPQQFHVAHAALEREGLLVRAVQPGGTLGTIGIVHGLPNQRGWLWVAAHELQRAEECLDEAGVVSSLNARPIVDRAEPICPKCLATLDPEEREVCHSCGAAFTWVDIDHEPLDPTGEMCHRCGYDLTGNTSGECPECAASVKASILLSVNAGAKPPESTESHFTQRKLPFAVKFIASVVLLFIAINVGATLNAPAGLLFLLIIALYLAIFVGAVVLIAVVIRALTQT